MTTPIEVHMIDFHPTTRELARLVAGIADEQLEAPTPCAGTTVRHLLAHVDGLSLAFAEAAAKRAGETPGGVGDDQLADGWRTRIPARLEALAEAWEDPAAWTGQTRIGGTDQTGESCALIALDELVVHAWDLASATGQGMSVDEGVVATAADFVGPFAEHQPDGVPGLFGPVVPVPADAPPLDRLLGLTGRDPHWSPPS